MPSRHPRGPDLASFAAAYRRRVVASCPDHADLAFRLIDRLPPEQWRLEWCLPWWLGETFGVEPAIRTELCVSNLLGLGAIRLTDDLADGELAPADAEAAPALIAALHAASRATYDRLFATASPMWPIFAARLAAWREATAARLRDRFDPDDADAVHSLATRGAPLQIGASAIALLCGRDDAIPMIDDCLDRALSAHVMYDDFADWRDDVDAGRSNVFVAFAGGTREDVLLALLRGRELAYTNRLKREAIAAAVLATQLGCPPLATHLRVFARRANREFREARRQNRQRTIRATELLFGIAS
jgi:hypothetical protein